MNSELEILKKIWENNGETYIKLISNQSGFGIDYTRYICNCLFKKGEIKPIKGKRDWYRITSKGKKELKLYGIIKPGIPRKISEVEKVVYYLPRKLKTRPKKLEINPVRDSKEKKKVQGKQISNGVKTAVGPKELKSNLVVAEEKKLNWGKKIEKAVAFLIKRSNKEEK